MTKQKQLKQRIRARMEKTGERYSTARRHIIANQPGRGSQQADHMPGVIAAPTALRILLAAAGVNNPTTSQPYSESLLFGIAGGIGMGIFTFRYEQQDFSSFYIAGRCCWHDDHAYLTAALERLGVATTVKESGGSKAADKQLREGLQHGGPVIAWVDAGSMPYKAMPDHMQGGVYHVVTVYQVDDEEDAVLVGDLTDDPIRLSREEFTTARARIKKQKNRVLWFESVQGTQDLEAFIRQGLKACHDGLAGKSGALPGPKSMAKNFSLASLQTWAGRMYGSKGKEDWSKMFPLGKNLWRGLTSIYNFIHFGTGGGLMRPMFASFLREAAEAIPQERVLLELAERYEQLGTKWDELADEALPDGVPAFRRHKRLTVEQAELQSSGDRTRIPKTREVWNKVCQLEEDAGECFPLNESQSDELRQHLQSRIQELFELENAALDLLASFA